jgi:hypothetical protein
MNDLSAKIEQSAVDKLLKSVNFPLTIVDVVTPPPGNLFTRELINENEITLSDTQAQELLTALSKVNTTHIQTIPSINDGENKFYQEALSNISTTIESAKACLKALEAPQIQTSSGQIFSFPDKTYLEKIVNGGVEGLLQTTKGLEIKAICSDLKVIANNRPGLSLNGPKISVSNAKITVKATGELWSHLPSFHCSRWCTNWTITWRWVKLASVSVSVTIDLDAYIELISNGKIVSARGHVNKLRLAYPILKEIPLENIANNYLQGKLVPVFDAGSFIASVPVINSRFAIDSISIPNATGFTEIDISIKQL